MEQEWATALLDGLSVRVDVRPVYDAGGVRPSSFEVDYEINGVKYERDFPNSSGD